MKNLIITADDFGVFPSINQGVKESILAGKVNSVAAIANYKDSVKNVKELITEVGERADIGCHLTISSGEPLVAKNHNAFTNGGYFRPFGELKITQLEKNTELLEEELTAQVQVFKDADINITNLSCHHSTLTNTPKLFDVYLKVSEKFDLPIRSVNITPGGKDNTYRTILQLMLLDDIPASKVKEIKSFGNRITDYLNENKPNIKTPSVLESRHYGPPPFVEVLDVSMKRLVRKKHDELKEFMDDFIANDHKFTELMLHLIKDDIYLKEQDDDIVYPGVNKKYFDSRNVEFQSINTFDFSPYLDRIKLNSWKELGAK